MTRQDEAKQGKVKWGKIRLNEDRIDLSKILLRVVPHQSNRNLVKVSVLTKSKQGLSKIWAEVVILTERNHTTIDIKSENSRV